MTVQRIMGVLFLMTALVTAGLGLRAFYERFVLGTGPTDAVVVAALLSLAQAAAGALLLVGVSRARATLKRVSRNPDNRRNE